jgi:hypothetical protein
LNDNPESRIINSRKQIIDSLKAENEQLRLQTQRGSSSMSSIPPESFQALKSQLDQLEKDVASRDTMIMRLKQVFGSKIQGYRQFVQSALGMMSLRSRV